MKLLWLSLFVLLGVCLFYSQVWAALGVIITGFVVLGLRWFIIRKHDSNSN
jgi:hypothetical protein